MSRCFDFADCSYYNWSVCNEIHTDARYNDVSSAWVLIAAILVFFMKAGFMLVELSFTHELRDQRNVVVIKYLDACASAFGFFLIGFDAISRYISPQGVHIAFFMITDPVLWFFKFTFASNAATIIGGCLVTNRYKMRLPAAFISAFVISGIVHPLITYLMWSDHCNSLSAYRFCQDAPQTQRCAFSCDGSSPPSFANRLYALDFAGGGAVHLVGGVAGLVLCLFAKLQKWRGSRGKSKKRKKKKKSPFRTRQLKAPLMKEEDELEEEGDSNGTVAAEGMREEGEEPIARNFLEWMYPPNGGSEKVGEAALGVIILWFCWFAFNCGSTGSLESNRAPTPPDIYHVFPYHAIPSLIAVNMIMATASGGITAICIASWAQLYSKTVSLNANEIANGILTSLVAITAGCPFVTYWGACVIGFIAVILYHVGCFLEYKLGIEDTARVVPVHAVGGLWSLIAAGLLVFTSQAVCNLHATFEGLCYCELRLPPLNYGERLLAQLIAAVLMIGITGVACVVIYGLLYLLPIWPFVWLLSRVFFLRKHGELTFYGNWLLTSPLEDQMQWGTYNLATAFSSSYVQSSASSTPLPLPRQSHEVAHVPPVQLAAGSNTSSGVSSDPQNLTAPGDLSLSHREPRGSDAVNPEEVMQRKLSHQSHHHGSVSWRRRGGSITTDELELTSSANENP